MEEIAWFFLPLDAIIKSARCYNRYGFMEPWEHMFISQTNNYNLPHWMFGFLPGLGLGTDAKLDNASV